MPQAKLAETRCHTRTELSGALAPAVPSLLTYALSYLRERRILAAQRKMGIEHAIPAWSVVSSDGTPCKRTS